MSSAFPLARFIVPPVIDQICLARKEIMGYVGRIACRRAFVDNVIVFAIFLTVCSPPQQSSSFSKGQHRTGIYRWHFSSGCCMVNSIAIYPCHTTLTFPNPYAVDFSPTVSQRVSGIAN